MAASDMKELLKHELGDLLYAEQLILKMLGTLTKEVQNPEMLNRVKEHMGETEEQIERLRRAFESVGEKARAEKCEAAIGLKEEHDSFKKDEKPSKALLEAFDLGNSLRVEHYEIAGYRSAIAVATAMGQRDVVALLSESLREEEAMASFIERSSVRALKGLAAGMDLAAGNAEIVLTVDGGGSSSRSRSSGSKSSGSKSSGGKSSGSSASRSGSRSNGRSTTSDTGSSGGRSSSSRGSSSGGGKSSSGGSSRSSSGKSNGSTTASKSSSGGSSSRSSGSKSSGAKSSSGTNSSGGRSSASRSSGGSSSRTTADRSSSGGSSSGSRSSSSKSSGGTTASKSSSGKSGGSSSKSGGSKSGSSSSRSRSSGGGGGSART